MVENRTGLFCNEINVGLSKEDCGVIMKMVINPKLVGRIANKLEEVDNGNNLNKCVEKKRVIRVNRRLTQTVG